MSVVVSFDPLSSWKVVLASSGRRSSPTLSARACSVSKSFPSITALLNWLVASPIACLVLLVVVSACEGGVPQKVQACNLCMGGGIPTCKHRGRSSGLMRKQSMFLFTVA